MHLVALPTLTKLEIKSIEKLQKWFMPTERIKRFNCTYEKRIAKLGLLTFELRRL